MLRVIYFVVLCLVISSCQSKVTNDKKDLEFSQEALGLNSYWVKYNFTKSEVENYPDMIEQSLVDYISHFSEYPLDVVKSSLKDLIKKSETDTNFYFFLRNKFANYLYHPNSPFRNDLYYEEVLLAYNESPLLSRDLSSVDSMVIELLKKNKVNTQAANFDFVVSSMKEYQLYDIQAPYKLLVFYDPQCAHCKEVVSSMKSSSVLNNAIASNVLKVLAIDVLGDYTAWQSYQGQIPANWINGFNLSGTVRQNTLYNILAYPTLYLLDKTNKVLLKDVYFNDVERHISN